MDTYADSYISYRADLDYRREQLVAGLGAGRSARRKRRSRSKLIAAAPATTSRTARSLYARSA